jgi:hypothetical protein
LAVSGTRFPFENDYPIDMRLLNGLPNAIMWDKKPIPFRKKGNTVDLVKLQSLKTPLQRYKYMCANGFSDVRPAHKEAMMVLRNFINRVYAFVDAQTMPLAILQETTNHLGIHVSKIDQNKSLFMPGRNKTDKRIFAEFNSYVLALQATKRVLRRMNLKIEPCGDIFNKIFSQGMRVEFETVNRTRDATSPYLYYVHH